MRKSIMRLFRIKYDLIEPSGLLMNPLTEQFSCQLPPIRNFSGYEREFIGADLSGMDGACSCLPRTRSFR